MTLIGCRCRGGDVHSRAVLIARRLCPKGACVGFGVVVSPRLFSPVPVNRRMYQSYSGGFSPGVPPLPIPNREVKPGRADGTAPQCGRVGRRLLEEDAFWRDPGSVLLSFVFFSPSLFLSYISCSFRVERVLSGRCFCVWVLCCDGWALWGG